MDGQRAPEVKREGVALSEGRGSSLVLFPMKTPSSSQVSAPGSVPPVGRGRSQEGAAHARHPGPAGALPVQELDGPQGERWAGVVQGSQHGDGLLSPPQLHRHRTGESQVRSWCT